MNTNKNKNNIYTPTKNGPSQQLPPDLELRTKKAKKHGESKAKKERKSVAKAKRLSNSENGGQANFLVDGKSAGEPTKPTTGGEGEREGDPRSQLPDKIDPVEGLSGPRRTSTPKLLTFGCLQWVAILYFFSRSIT